MLAIINATIIDGTGHDPYGNGTVLIDGDHIHAVGEKNKVSIPCDATVLDAQGASLLPGLIDTHVHMMTEQPSLLSLLNTPPSLRLFEAIPRLRATLHNGTRRWGHTCRYQNGGGTGNYCRSSYAGGNLLNLANGRTRRSSLSMLPRPRLLWLEVT